MHVSGVSRLRSPLLVSREAVESVAMCCVFVQGATDVVDVRNRQRPIDPLFMTGLEAAITLSCMSTADIKGFYNSNGPPISRRYPAFAPHHFDVASKK